MLMGGKKELNICKKNDVWFHNEGIAIEKAGKYDTLKNHIERYDLLEIFFTKN